MIIFALLLSYNIYSYCQFHKLFERVDSPHFGVTIGLYLQMCGIFFEFIHLWMYSYNGRGIPLFDVFSLISFMLSEIAISCLLMMMAYGWTFSFQEIDWDNNLEIYLPVGAIVVAVHFVLAAMTYIDIDAHHKYHDYSGIQGWVLIVFKMALFAYFFYCYEVNREKIPKRSLDFYRILIYLGALYMISTPLTIFASYFFQPYDRQYFYTLSTHMVQLITAVLFLY